MKADETEDANASAPAPAPAPRRIDALVLVAGLSIASLIDVRSLAGLLASYACAWALTEVALRTRWASALRTVPGLVLSLLAVVPAIVVARRLPSIFADEGLRGIDARLGDRMRLAGAATIDPSLLRMDRPQAFVVRADDASAVALTIDGVDFAARALGAGAFVIDLDPTTLALDAPSVVATLHVDGVAHRRTLEVVAAAARPGALVASVDGDRACAISEATDEVLLIDTDGVSRLTVPERPVACAITEAGLLVAHRDGTVRSVGSSPAVTSAPCAITAMAASDAAQVVIGRIDTGDERLASALVVVGDGRIAELIGIADHVALVGPDPEAPSHAVVALRAPARLLALSLADLRVTAERRLRAPATALAASGERVVIAATDFSEDGAAHLGNHFVDDQLVELRASDLAVVSVLHTAGRTPAQDRAGDVDVGAGPAGISFDGAAVVVSFTGTRDVARYERWDAPPERLALRGIDDEEHAPTGAVRLADGTLVIVSPASGTVLRARDGEVHVERSAPSGADLLRRDPAALRARMGELAFGEATRSGVACASCHPGGESDHEGHNIGGRVRAPTLPVLGVGGTAPYLRDGSYPRLRDLHEVSIEEYRGYRFGAGDRGATIAGWIERSARPEIHVTADPADVAAGAAVFVRAECVHCHVPPAFTDLGLHAASAVFPDHDFGEVTALDTPSLRGLSESPPYLYDGRAASLRAVITEQNGGDRHGHTAALSPADVDALVAFLRAIP